MKTALCKKCPRRGCGQYHDQCEDYQTWHREREAEIEKYHEEGKKWTKIQTSIR